MAPLLPPSSLPPPTPPRLDWPIPTFSLRIDDLSHPGIKLFLDNVDPIRVMHHATVAVLQWLYTTTDKAPKKCVNSSGLQASQGNAFNPAFFFAVCRAYYSSFDPWMA